MWSIDVSKYNCWKVLETITSHLKLFLHYLFFILAAKIIGYPGYFLTEKATYCDWLRAGKFIVNS